MGLRYLKNYRRQLYPKFLLFLSQDYCICYFYFLSCFQEVHSRRICDCHKPHMNRVDDISSIYQLHHHAAQLRSYFHLAKFHMDELK